VVGCGQSGLEAAALLHESGATVELIVRGRDVTWINHGFWKRGPAKRVLYAPSDVGPALLSWLIAYPLAYRRLPRPLRVRGDRRPLRPAGALAVGTFGPLFRFVAGAQVAARQIAAAAAG